MKSRQPWEPYTPREMSMPSDLAFDQEYDDLFEFLGAEDELANEIRRRRTRRPRRASPSATGRGNTARRSRRPPPRTRRDTGRRRSSRRRRRPRPRPPRPRFPIRRRRRPIFLPSPASPCICPSQGTEYLRWVQSALNRFYGLRLPVDGVANSTTRKAIRRFQNEKGLPVDGIAGPDTQRALLDAGSTSAQTSSEPVQSEMSYYPSRRSYTPYQSGRGNKILWVQKALNSIMGLRLAADGILGPATRSAIRSFQRRYGLAVDGIVGPRTEAKLISLTGPSSRPLRPPATTAPAPAPTTDPSSPVGAVLVSLGTNARVSDNALSVLKRILHDAGLTRATITSGRRTSEDQARIMYDLISRHGVSYAKNLYGRSGDRVIDVYDAQKRMGNSPTAIKQAMEAKIKTLGCHHVSHHCSDEYDVFDVGPSSITNQTAFRGALKRALERGIIDNYITPPEDPAYHIEIKLKPIAGTIP